MFGGVGSENAKGAGSSDKALGEPAADEVVKKKPDQRRGGEAGSPLGHRSVETLESEGYFSFDDALKNEISEENFKFRQSSREEQIQLLNERVSRLVKFKSTEDSKQNQKENCKKLFTEICQPSFKKLSREEQCGILLSVALLAKQSEEEREENAVYKHLVSEFSDLLIDYLDLIETYQSFCSKGVTSEQRLEVNDFIRSATDHAFFPALWWIIQQLLEPEQSIASPRMLVAIISQVWKTQKTNALVLTAFSSVESRLIGADKEVIDMMRFSCYLQEDISKTQSPFNYEIKRKLAGIIQIVVSSYETHKKETGMAVLMDPEIVQALGAEGKEVEELLQQEKSNARRCTELLYSLKNKVGLSEYHKNILGLVEVWFFRYKKLTEVVNPLQQAEKICKLSRRGGFPLLLMDAANTFAGSGLYKRAAECYKSLMAKPLSESMNEYVVCQYELMQHWVKEEEQQLVLRQAREMEELKKSSFPEARKKRTFKKKGGKKNKPPRQVSGAAKRYVQSSDVASGSDSESSVRSAQPMKTSPQPMEASPPISKNETPIDLTTLGWVPDSDSRIQSFLGELQFIRDGRSWTLPLEAECFKRWLSESRGSDAYGRVCEEVAWFYLRQAWLPWNEMHNVEKDSPQDKKDQIYIASQWLAKAESCYLAKPVTARLRVEELKEDLEEIKQRKPEWYKLEEYKKRLVAICSSRGHIHSTLAGLARGKRRQYYNRVARGFYELKTLANPQYNKAATSVQESKLKIIPHK